MRSNTTIFERYQGSLCELSIESASIAGLHNIRTFAHNALKKRKQTKEKNAFLRECMAHIEKRIGGFQQVCWVNNLNNYCPNKEGHWPSYTAGFNLSLNGRIWLTDNSPIPINRPLAQGIIYPCHRDLVSGEGEDKTIYSGLYCFNPNHEFALYLYPDTTNALNHAMKIALASLIGVDRISAQTVVYANSPRKKLFSLAEV